MIAYRECGEAIVKNHGVRQNEQMNTYVVNFAEGSMRVQAKNEAEALSILAEWFECSPTVLLEVI
jgi:hypothetical protein